MSKTDIVPLRESNKKLQRAHGGHEMMNARDGGAAGRDIEYIIHHAPYHGAPNYAGAAATEAGPSSTNLILTIFVIFTMITLLLCLAVPLYLSYCGGQYMNVC